MKSMRCIWGIGILLILLLAAGLLYIGLSGGYADKRADLKRLSEENYNGVFLSAYDISSFSEEDFVTYRGVQVVKASYTLQKETELAEYLNRAFDSENEITNIYLGIDPEKAAPDEVRQTLAPFLDAHPEVAFEILLPAPMLKYWVAEGTEGLQSALECYGALVEELTAYENVIMYYMGGEEWLIANEGNYLSEFAQNEAVAQRIFLLTFCDHEYVIAPGNAQILFDRLITQAQREWANPSVYPDLGDWCMVFLGDSVIAYAQDSTSVSGVVGGLTGAQTYNCGQGGIPATVDPAAALSFPEMAEYLISGELTGADKDSDFYRGAAKFLEDDHEGKSYCFVLNFGLNDYFGGHPVENPADPYDTGTYAGALRSGIAALQEAYPDAIVLVLTPTYTTFFSEGTDRNSDAGGVLTDYVEAAQRVADEMGVYSLNNYAQLGIDAETAEMYLADGCHPNNAGRLLMGRTIVSWMGEICEK